jgi:hypothetical protein
MRAAGGSPSVMLFLSRLRARRSLDAASAERLLAGRGVPPGAPAGQYALARLLEIAAGPGSEQELAGEVAAAAVFVQVTSQVRSRMVVRRVLVAAACALAVGGTVGYASVVSPPLHNKVVPVQFGAPASHHPVQAPAVSVPSRQPGKLQVRPKGRVGQQGFHPAMDRSVPLGARGR